MQSWKVRINIKNNNYKALSSTDIPNCWYFRLSIYYSHILFLPRISCSPPTRDEQECILCTGPTSRDVRVGMVISEQTLGDLWVFSTLEIRFIVIPSSRSTVELNKSLHLSEPWLNHLQNETMTSASELRLQFSEITWLKYLARNRCSINNNTV